MTQGTCAVDSCPQTVPQRGSARGLCRGHYARLMKYGSPLGVPAPRQYPSVATRFWAKVDLNASPPAARPELGGCWLWTGARNDKGYGSFWGGAFDRRTYTAHGWSWTQRHGAIPHDLELDHLCRVRNCVNPAHLEPVVHKVNVDRGDAGAHIASRDHCPQGHPYSGPNLCIRANGARVCRTCARDATRRYRAKRIQPSQ